jgi:hypothetical protein
LFLARNVLRMLTATTSYVLLALRDNMQNTNSPRLSLAVVQLA